MNAVSLSDLPVEILVHCFKCLPTFFPLVRIALVCRLFYNITASFRFRSITLSSRNSIDAFSTYLFEQEDKPLDPALLIRELAVRGTYSFQDGLGQVYNQGNQEEEFDAIFDSDDTDEAEMESDESSESDIEYAPSGIHFAPPLAPASKPQYDYNGEDDLSYPSSPVQGAESISTSTMQAVGLEMFREEGAQEQPDGDERQGHSTDMGGRADVDLPQRSKGELLEIRLGQAIQRCSNLEALLLFRYDFPKLHPLGDAISFLQPFGMLTRLEIHGNVIGTDIFSELAHSTKGLRTLKMVDTCSWMQTAVFCCKCASFWSDLRELVLIGFEPRVRYHDHEIVRGHLSAQSVDGKVVDPALEGQEYEFRGVDYSFSSFLRQQKNLESLHIDNVDEPQPQTYLFPNHVEDHQSVRLTTPLSDAWPYLVRLNAPLQQCHALLEMSQPLLKELSVIPCQDDNDGLWPIFFERLAERASSQLSPTRVKKAKFVFPCMSFSLGTIEAMIQGCIDVQQLSFIESLSAARLDVSDAEIIQRITPFARLRGKVQKLMLSASSLVGGNTCPIRDIDFMHRHLVDLVGLPKSQVVFA